MFTIVNFFPPKRNKDNAEWYFSYNSQLVYNNLDQIFKIHTIFNPKLA